MAIFNPRQAVQKLRDRGLDEPQADGIVEVVEDATGAATSDLVTKADIAALESRMEARVLSAINRAMGLVIAAMGVIAAIALAIAELT